jgi:hypothetical protein
VPIKAIPKALKPNQEQTMKILGRVRNGRLILCRKTGRAGISKGCLYTKKVKQVS